ncbi:hypothetical protein [Nonomuraea turkmeniaca]|nr:hypothetical protein [Nonomuraea turkmeniaca]
MIDDAPAGACSRCSAAPRIATAFLRPKARIGPQGETVGGEMGRLRASLA